MPSLDVEVGGGGAAVQATVDLFRTDLGSGATLALPRLGLWAHLGRSDGGAEPLALDLPAVGPTPAVRIEAVRVGMQLDDNRRPTFVLAADRVDDREPRVPDARPHLDRRVDGRGRGRGRRRPRRSARRARRRGRRRPTAAGDRRAARPSHRLDRSRSPTLAADPLGTFRGYWQTLVTTHPDAFAELLGVVRDVIGTTGTAVSGTGTADDPWHVPLGAVPPTGFELQVFAVGSELHVAVAGTTRVDTLGNPLHGRRGHARLSSSRPSTWTAGTRA